MRRNKIFQQMVATQHLDQHWSQDLQVWVCLLLPPLQCGQGPQRRIPWRACHLTAARESNSSARGCWDDRISAPGSVCWWSFLLTFVQKRSSFSFFEFELLRSQPRWVTFCQWRVKNVGSWCLIHLAGTHASLVYDAIDTEHSILSIHVQKRYFFWFWAPRATVSK